LGFAVSRQNNRTLEEDFHKHLCGMLFGTRVLPHDIIYRPKYGFPVPFKLWMEDIQEWDLDQEIFCGTDISGFTGWKKFMLINLDAFVKAFKKYSA